MSKLSFRARALDATKPLPVYKTEEIPDLPDFANISRAVPQMPTGMEKEEETEHHLQRALSAQQVYGTAEALVIPIPEIDNVTPDYKKLYEKDGGYKPPRQYIHVQPFGMDQEIPDYDMDSEDEGWLGKQSRKLEVTPLKFETMMDRLEKGSGQTVMTLHEAKALLKEDDDLIIAVYDYWLNKRLKLQHALIPSVRSEKRDGSVSSNNPYVAFRRRSEKMITRKNRKTDESSYEKMLKLRRDLNKALTILELMKRREKSKKELLKLTIEIVEKRHQEQDYDGKMYAEANAKRHTLPSTFIQSYNEYINARKWADRVSRREEQTYVKKSSKRKYNKRKEHHHHRERTHGSNHVTGGGHMTVAPQVSSLSREREATVSLPQYTEVDVMQDTYSSEEELSPQLSASDHEQDSSENDPDGVYAFKRKPDCQYHAPIDPGRGNWPWHGQEEGGIGDTKYRYSLSSLAQPRPRCYGFGRRRFGRGGRVLFDRVSTDWDDTLNGLDLTSTGDQDDIANTYKQHLTHHSIPHFRPRTPTDEELYGRDTHLFGTNTPPLSVTEFSLETYEHHREQLLQMTRAQRLAQDATPGSNNPSASTSHVGFHSYCSDLSSSIGGGVNSRSDILGQSFSSQPNSKFTLDSERAQFAASAVCRSMTSQSTTSQSVITASSSSATVVTSSSIVHTSQAGDCDVISSQSAVAPCISGDPTSRTSSPLVFQNGPVEVKPSVFSTSPAANVLQLNYPINDTTRQVSGVNKTSSLVANSNQSSATSFSFVTHQNVSNNANSSNTVSLVTQGSNASSLAQSLATGGISLITQNHDHNRLLNNTSRFPVVSVATKCVSPATPTLLKIGSTAQIQHHNSKETLEGASLLKDKVVVMEVT